MTLITREQKQYLFQTLCLLSTLLVVSILLVLLLHIFLEGKDWLSFDFLTSYPSRRPHLAGIKAALYGSFWIISLTTLISVFIGVSTALFLEEYAPKNSKWVYFLQINIANLAGMPSIIYGLLGLTIFVRFFALDQSVLAGSLTLSLLVIPIIIMASQGAIRSVPQSLRDAAFALGAYKWQVVCLQVLPAASAGILTGIILSTSRAIGEAAPLIMIGALSFVAFTPENIMDSFTVLPVQIFNWASRPQEDFHSLAAAGIIVLLSLLLSLNFLAILIRNYSRKRYKL